MIYIGKYYYFLNWYYTKYILVIYCDWYSKHIVVTQEEIESDNNHLPCIQYIFVHLRRYTTAALHPCTIFYFVFNKFCCLFFLSFSAILCFTCDNTDTLSYRKGYVAADLLFYLIGIIIVQLIIIDYNWNMYYTIHIL